MSTDKKKPILFDYRTVPEIAADIKHLEMIRNHKDPQVARTADNCLMDQDKIIQLTVKVTDPLLAQVVLQSGWGGSIPIPGMEIHEMRIHDLARKSDIITWLQQKILELENS